MFKTSLGEPWGRLYSGTAFHGRATFLMDIDRFGYPSKMVFMVAFWASVFVGYLLQERFPPAPTRIRGVNVLDD